MNKYGLIGKTISYSKSPKLHNIIAKHFGYKIKYELIDIDESDIMFYLEKLKNGIFRGFNITVPYKETIMKHLDVLTDKAKKIKAVNTVYLNSDGLLVGDNTDYYGFEKLLEKGDIKKELTKAYILGTGGAAKTVYHVLNDLNIITINVSRSQNDQKDFKKVISYGEFKDINKVEFLINCTPVGTTLIPGMAIKQSDQKIEVVIDLIYNPLKTELMKLAKKSINGIDMLIFQALKSQSIWKKDNRIIALKESLYDDIKEELINEFIR